MRWILMGAFGTMWVLASLAGLWALYGHFTDTPLWPATTQTSTASTESASLRQANTKLTAQIENLEKENERLEALLEAKQEVPAKSGPSDPDEEKAAGELLQAVTEAMEAGQYDEAKDQLAELKSRHGNTRTARAAARVEGELNVFGKDAMALNVDKWHQGYVNLDEGKASLLIFWEVWCPHCKREVPRVQKVYEDHRNKGLQVVGITKQSRDKTDADVMAFLRENGVTYPIAKENGDLSTHYGVRGVPAAAVVKGGKVVWRGHPSRITPEMLNRWTNSSGFY